MVKFQYISDTHLEHHKNNNMFLKLKRLDDCENICVLGDIGYPNTPIYKSFINYLSENWKNVFLLMGNHCYYTTSKMEIKIMSEIEDYVKKNIPNNVYFMNNTALYINKLSNKVSDKPSNNLNDYIKIIGSTLWSDIDDLTASNLNDYRNIYLERINNDYGIEMFRKLKPQNTRNIFKISKKFILDQIKENTDINCLILTHHGTHPLCQGHYIDSQLGSGYFTHIPEIFESKNVLAVICGHTHSSVNLEILTSDKQHKIKLLSNCYGYLGESYNIVRYNNKAIIDI